MASEQAERPAAAASTEAAGEFFDHQTGPFFRRADWGAFWITFGISMVAYFHTLAPTVTLEDSGELAVASDYLGVPHPPGYPIWTLLTWFFQWIFHWVKYFGQPDSNWMLVLRSLKDVFDPTMTGYPNPAWSVGLCSAFFGALACGLLALLVSRSGSDILRSLRRETEVLGLQTESRICLICGVTGGLLFAFSSVLWSQSTIVEVYSLNAFFMVLTLLLTYRWMCRPHEDKTLYTVAFVFGLGLTNHQTLVFLGPAMLAAMWFRDRELFRDAIGALLVLVAGLLFKKAMDINPAGASPTLLEHKQTLYIGGLVCLALLVGVFLVQRQLFTAWKRLSIAGGLAFLGVSFYFGYLPVSSEQNPPMNWGYPRTVEGFWHAVSRGQYEKISPVDNLKDALTKNPTKYPRLCWKIIFEPGEYTSVVAQFTFWLCLPALLIPFFVARMSHKARDWLLISAIAFVFLTFVFIIFQYPTLDVQQLFIGRVQYIQAHAILAVWISYGLIFALAWIDTRTGGNPAVKFAGSAFVALLPLVPVGINAYDQKFINLVGGSEQNGHDFGWQFGAWQLEGARAILHDIGPEEAKSYPNPDYPPPMDTNAVFFGGTDPGRFVPTYMIYSAHFREDVYLITQNALADNTYMNVMRDLYGDRIWIPSQQDSNLAFQQYVQDVQSGKIPAGAEVSFEGGRVSVQGVAGVMTINGILARMIYDANKLQHSFYVEESYVIPWMYEFLEPHGLIMKINKEPVKITPEMVKNDREFWDWYTKRLTSNPKLPPRRGGPQNLLQAAQRHRRHLRRPPHVRRRRARLQPGHPALPAQPGGQLPPGRYLPAAVPVRQGPRGHRGVPHPRQGERQGPRLPQADQGHRAAGHPPPRAGRRAGQGRPDRRRHGAGRHLPPHEPDGPLRRPLQQHYQPGRHPAELPDADRADVCRPQAAGHGGHGVPQGPGARARQRPHLGGPRRRARVYAAGQRGHGCAAQGRGSGRRTGARHGAPRSAFRPAAPAARLQRPDPAGAGGQPEPEHGPARAGRILDPPAAGSSNAQPATHKQTPKRKVPMVGTFHGAHAR
jgi:hypothetical protein